jgi:hypothetical protein
MEILVSDWDNNNDILIIEKKYETVNNSMYSYDCGEKEIHICNANPTKYKYKFILTNKFSIFSFFTPKTRTGQLFLNKKRKIKMFSTRKKNRKEMIDNILKKIKSKFFKCLRQALINRLKKDKKNFRFSFKFSQKFIRDVTKNNNKYWDETLFDFAFKNLEGNNNEYLLSQEFEDSLPNENEGQNYINSYKNKAKDFINYYTNNHNNYIINNKNSEEIIKPEYEQFFVPNYNFDASVLVGDSYDEYIGSLSGSLKFESNSDIFKESL